MRWFDGLREGSISSFKELTRAFGAHFVICSRVPRPLDSLLSMAMRDEKTMKTYFNRYWEIFNEIDGDFDAVVIRTFKVGLLAEHDLRKSLTKKPIRSVRQLIDRIDEYKRVEENQKQERGKLRWSLRTEGLSNWIDTITTGLGEILQGIQDPLLLR